MLAQRVPLPAKKVYRLVFGVEPLPASGILSSHVDGKKNLELIACAESDDSSDESSDKKEKSSKKDKKEKAGKLGLT